MAMKIQFGFKQKPHDQLLHFKVDGGRFDSEKTIKCNVNAKYAIDITVRPPRDIRKFVIHGGDVSLTEKHRDLESLVFVGDWLTSGIEKTKKGLRSKLPISLQFHDGEEFFTTLQCKFYPESEKEHCHWGTALHQLEYECQITDGRVRVLKETFR